MAYYETIISNRKSTNKQTVTMNVDNKIIDPKEIVHIFNYYGVISYKTHL